MHAQMTPRQDKHHLVSHAKEEVNNLKLLSIIVLILGIDSGI